MDVVYHDIDARWFEPPTAWLEIDADGQLTVHEGFWPDVGGAFVAVHTASLPLVASDGAVMLAREGPQLTPSDQVQPYGMRPVAGGYEVQAYVDLLAWREGDDWHIKRLVQG